MAKARCDGPCRGVVDRAVGEAGLGPRILVRTDDALVADFVPGATLGEADVRRDGCKLAISEIAPKLRQLHALATPPPLPDAPAALWRGVDAMLSRCGDATISQKVLAREAARMRRAVDAVAAADVLGHGDLKPSNVLLVDGRTTFIDFELSGPNYRGYDIYKLFRTKALPPVPDDELLRFVEAYLGDGAAPGAAVACALESRIFEPLTWLEAAIFFAFAAATLPEKRVEMAALARDRWAAYEDCAGSAFDTAVAALERERQVAAL
mmetsp:Transcript_8315/g.26004  ORF Transcript_8315/g.26004 Transcript_8315/m.26004 type:complete len:266 (+) Transcript_8315:2-799(+)